MNAPPGGQRPRGGAPKAGAQSPRVSGTQSTRASGTQAPGASGRDTAAMRGTPRIGLFGGTFDPVHNGHLALARSALEHLKLDEVRWIPAGAPWQKEDRPLSAPEHRAAMVRLAILGEERFHADESELRRAGPSYTIDTVDALLQERPQAQIVLIIGQDQYARLHTWREWHALLSRVTLAVAARDGVIGRAAPQLLGVWHRVELLPMPEVPISSTDVRAMVARGEDIRALVPAPVARYIELHGLYRQGTPAN
jgi:nicotinate-nucleotide adenylyltransferase